MTIPRTRARALAAAAVAALAAALLLAPAGAQAATLKACANKKTGAIRLISGKKKCRKSEKKISWNTKGVAGRNGADGSNGTNGTNGANGTNGTPGVAGEPQKIVKFSASQGSTNSTNLVALFTADGISYSFNCGFAFILNVAAIKADGPSGTSYAAGVLRRPTGATRQSADPWSDAIFATLGGSAKTIASHTTLADAGDGIEQDGVWTVTVEGPTSTTWIHAKIVAAATCTVQGTAITVAN